MRQVDGTQDRDDGRGGGVNDDDLIEELAWMLTRIATNYQREGSGPGSRFAGQRLEVVQAGAVLRRIREVAARKGAA